MESISCVICRRRKIKCDRRPITCANCSKFGVPCTYDRSSSSATSASGPGLGTHRPGGTLSSTSTTTQAGLLRRRILRSCMACKRAKAKCSGGESCTRCTRRSLACVYEGGRRDTTPSTAPAAALAPGATSMGPPTTIIDNEHITDEPSGTFPSPVSAEHDDSAPLSPPQPLAPPPAIPEWLTAPGLPPMDRLRGLLDSYFVRIHPLRCMGFLHMPTFYERLNDPASLYADEYGLVHAICALVAPFAYADAVALSSSTSSSTPAATPRFYEAGSGWASSAMQRIFHHLGTPDVESLMTEMLVHEYYLRNGEYAKAFMLSGVVARHVQVLQLNLEHDCDLPSQQRRGGASSSSGTISWSTKECRRRLVWCCFLQDAFMECGIDQLRFVNPADIQVQLPCTEELFVRSKPCVTEMLTPGRLLPFVDSATTNSGAVNLDLRAYYIRAMAIRAKVLKYVKHLHGDVPWSTDPRESRFACLDHELRALESSLPDELRMSPENTCVFRWSGWSGAGGSSGRLGLFYGLHILLAQTFNDLYRVGVANLVFPHHATLWIRTNAPLAFLVRCHRMCSSKAIVIASLLEELWQMDRLSLVDTPYPMHAQVCSSVLVMTLSSWQTLLRNNGGANSESLDSLDRSDSPAGFGGLDGLDSLTVRIFLPQHRRLLESNVAILDFIRAYVKADLYYESARQALRRFEQLEALGSVVEDGPSTAGGAAAESPQFSLEYILNPLGVYPMARQQARNRHEPEAISSPPTTTEKTQATRSVQRATQRTQNTRAVQKTHSVQVANTPVWNNTVATGDMVQQAYPQRPPAYDTSTTLLPMNQQIPMQSQAQQLPPQQMAGDLDMPDAGELSLFQMWDWESEVPSMDNMGYPTFLDFQVPSQ
ncbi:hypothetical protein SEUCBS139899_002661 [Sporothrix eucalyptigena]|uniref:Zn(2)-C6 fungal-type domain-containing protein n=1 Tax=Sporothrix eucalyptigena TaxID=1812306 RepID=A0ABP0AXX3_9PEZI